MWRNLSKKINFVLLPYVQYNIKFLKIYIYRKKKAEELLKKAESFFINQGVEYTSETIPGLPGDVLAKQAKSKAYDLIIMGSHGHSNIAGLFLGSVTHKVLNTIYCPVLVVP